MSFSSKTIQPKRFVSLLANNKFLIDPSQLWLKHEIIQSKPQYSDLNISHNLM